MTGYSQTLGSKIEFVNFLRNLSWGVYELLPADRQMTSYDFSQMFVHRDPLFFSLKLRVEKLCIVSAWSRMGCGWGYYFPRCQGFLFTYSQRDMSSLITACWHTLPSAVRVDDLCFSEEKRYWLNMEKLRFKEKKLNFFFKKKKDIKLNMFLRFPCRLSFRLEPCTLTGIESSVVTGENDK